MKKRVYLAIILLSISAFSMSACTENMGETLWNMDFSSGSLMRLMLLPIALTCLSEWLVAVLFKINRCYYGMILMTNLVSKIILATLPILLFFIFPTLFYVAIYFLFRFVFLLLGKVLMTTVEYFFYRGRMLELTNKECLNYTIVANVVSFVLYLLLNGMFV